MLAVYTSKGVTLEVNLREHISCMPPPSMNKCYVMLWPALTWRGQEWAQHVQGQLLHTCIMQTAGSPHVMEL